MLRFFRRIRNEVIEKDAFRKYVWYAIGEVLLVMVGILLALQVNNWNENRKDREREKEILTELSISLQQNIMEMEKDVQRRLNWNHSSDIIFNVMESDIVYVDTLNIHFQNARLPGTNLSLSLAGYEGLKNAGFEILRNRELRNEVVQLFEVTLHNLMEEMEYFEAFQPERQALTDELFSYEEEKFDPESPFTVPLTPHDYDALKDNLPYLAMIKSVKVQRNIIGVHLDRLLKKSMRVLEMVNKEINKS